jgi:hypothetical protein
MLLTPIPQKQPEIAAPPIKIKALSFHPELRDERKPNTRCE